LLYSTCMQQQQWPTYGHHVWMLLSIQRRHYSTQRDRQMCDDMLIADEATSVRAVLLVIWVSEA
jgi:hypothetical protein